MGLILSDGRGKCGCPRSGRDGRRLGPLLNELGTSS